jgi:peptidase M42 family hydrolase
MKKLPIDADHIGRVLRALLEIPSPTGYTDRIVHFVVSELERIGLDCALTRRGAIRAELRGQRHSPGCAIVSHLDTLGAMVTRLKPNGRLGVAPIGKWNSRFAEGARVIVFTDRHGSKRGTIIPLKASGHIYDEEVDVQPSTWENLEVRVDDPLETADDLRTTGFQIGDFVAWDPSPEFFGNGFVVSRHLDDKAGVAAVLGAIKAAIESRVEIPVDCHVLFTISEETGTGASAVLHGDVAEMVAVDNGTPGPNQASREQGVTVAMMDSSGPFDYHLTHRLLDLCKDFGIEHQRDVFRAYRCDAAAAVEAGNDLRVALVCFGVDASHGYERTHLSSLVSLAELLSLYIQSGPTRERDRDPLGPLSDFPTQPE